MNAGRTTRREHVERIRGRYARPERLLRTHNPCHKNDNAHVEQRNWTHVRQRLGCDRVEDPRLGDPPSPRGALRLRWRP